MTFLEPIIAIIVIIAIGYIFYEIITYLYSLNKSLKLKLDAEKLINIPEDFYKFNEELKIEIKEYNQKVLDVLNRFNNKTNDIDSRIDILINQVKEQDQELEKYRSGYEINHIKNSLNHFVNVYELSRDTYSELKDSKKESEYFANIEAIYELLDQALDLSGITQYYPKIGVDFTKDEAVSDNPDIVETDNDKLDNKIKEIIRPAYILKTSNMILIKAKVRIYKNKNR